MNIYIFILIIGLFGFKGLTEETEKKFLFLQYDAEKKEGLPVTPFMDREKITKPSSQCSFIGFVLLPLFEALGQLFPELEEMIVHPVRYALDYYRKLNEMAKDEQRQQRKSVVTLEPANSSISSPISPGNVNSIQVHLEQHEKLPTQKSEDASLFSDEGAQSLEDLTEEEEEETKTEVAVSEKTLKFKISTESSGVRSHPGSRKGSREKAQDFDIARVYRLERSNRTSESGADKRSWSSSENTSSYEDRRSDNSYEKRYHAFSPTTAIPEGSGELQNTLLNDKLCKLNKDAVAESSKSQSSSTRSPDLKRLMNRVVRDFRGSKNKVANGMKNTEDSSSKSDNSSKIASNTTRSQHKEPKSPSWMTTFLQNIKLRGASQDPDSQ